MAISTINQAGLTAPLTLTSPVLTTPTISTGAGTASFPSATGTVMVSGNMPAFSAYSNATQNPTSSVATKVVFGAKYYDTNNNFASSAFTPTVAGYYQLSASISMAADTNITAARIYIFKNGSGINIPMTENTGTSGVGYYTVSTSALVQANGSTDYFEVYGAIDGTGALRYFFSSTPSHATAFTGVLVRSA